MPVVMDVETRRVRSGTDGQPDTALARGRHPEYEASWEDHVLPAGVKYEALMTESEAFWGEDARAAMHPLYALVHKLRRTYAALCLVEASAGNQTLSDDEFDNLVSYRTTLWACTSEEEDFFGADVDSAVRKAEDFIRPRLHLRRHAG